MLGQDTTQQHSTSTSYTGLSIDPRTMYNATTFHFNQVYRVINIREHRAQYNITTYIRLQPGIYRYIRDPNTKYKTNIFYYNKVNRIINQNITFEVKKTC